MRFSLMALASYFFFIAINMRVVLFTVLFLYEAVKKKVV